MLLVIVWVGKGIIDGGDDDQEPSQDCQDPVCPECLNIVGFASGEGVCWGRLAVEGGEKDEFGAQEIEYTDGRLVDRRDVP